MIYQQYLNEAGEVINGIVLPKALDFRQLCPPTSNQEQTPHCAAHSVSNIAEALIWKQTGKLVALKEDEIYKLAKTFDGINGDGTTLEAAIHAAFLLGGFYGQPYLEKVPNNVDAIKRAIHKHTFLHIGLNITTKWSNCDGKIREGGIPIGGHALVACGYDDDGLYVQNSWGKAWGQMGFAEVPWPELQREWMYGLGIKVSTFS